jgi:hypothetical protein
MTVIIAGITIFESEKVVNRNMEPPPKKGEEMRALDLYINLIKKYKKRANFFLIWEL